MKQEAVRKPLSVLFALALAVGLMPVAPSTAYADPEVWSSDQTISADTPIADGVNVVESITLTIEGGKKLTVNGGIYIANNCTLTVAGKGTLEVTGKTGATGSEGAHGTDGGNPGGTGGTGENHPPGEQGKDGGSGGQGGNGGDGGVGVKGTVTVNSGTIVITGGDAGDAGQGGTGGRGGSGSPGGSRGGNGNPGNPGTTASAVSGTITENEDAQESDDGSAWTAISGTTSAKRYVKVAHLHSFTYSASGDTITAECSKTGCDLTENKATLTIVKPTLETYGQTGEGISASATLDGLEAFNTATGKTIAATDVKYAGRDGTTYAESVTAPTNAGKYTAKIEVEGKTASVDYAIAKADPTAAAPTGLTATYGDTLADVSLDGKNPSTNTPGTWAWADDTQSVGGVVDLAATFKANFTPDDAANYNTVSGVDVAVTVGKAANPATVAETATVVVGGSTVDLSENVALNGAEGEVAYAIDGDALGCTVDGEGVLTSGGSTGTVTVNVTVAADANRNASAAMPIAVTVADKAAQTITAEDVTATYGDTGKAVSATTDGDGALSYAVKDGADVVDVDPATGALTIKKAGAATVTVTAAETAACKQATKDVAVSIAHKYTEVPEVPATCTEPGVKGHWTDETGALYEDAEGATPTTLEALAIPALEHAWGEPAYEWADGNKTVTATRVCANDATHVETETAEATSEETKKATCEAKGETTYTAEFENAAFAKQEKAVADVDALGHDWGEWAQSEAPTCTEKGSETRTCKRDASHTETRDVDALGHDWGEWKVTKEATETEKGSEERVCAHDANHKEARDIPVKGHVHKLAKVEAKAATCTEDGNTEHWACTQGDNPCGRLFADAEGAEEINPEDTVVKATGHDWGDWAQTKAATCSAKGEEARACKRDASHTETREVAIDPTAHAWGEWAQTTAPTCGKSGAEARSCAHDASHTETREVEALGHDWGEPTYTWAVDNKSVTATRACKRDASHTETETAKTTSKVTKEPTETQEGERTYTAKFENAAFAQQKKTEAIPKKDPAPAGATYSNTKGGGATWTKGSSATADFTFERSVDDEQTFGHFTGIQVDGKDVPASDYTAEAGSVVVKLKPAFLETLSVGEHTITAIFDDGNNPSAKFTVKAAAASSTPAASGTTTPAASTTRTATSTAASGTAETTTRTADDAMPAAWALVALAAAGCALAARRRLAAPAGKHARR